ncbi:MAG TPA: geranylgeranyl reductase family protein [Candidatus Nanoarchaeia archaeon]|nr:geranylgeranyl reductase family protein [Candidatus Nanoarchaeia archaeon]
MNVVIVGAGPAGSAAAKALAQAGFSVDVFEEHVKIGSPIQCTGIVTSALFEFVEKNNEYITNELKGVRIIAPSGKTLEVPLHEWVICREKFDSFLARKAQEHGARYHTSHKFKEIKENKAVFQSNNKLIEKEFDILIGADGPFSAVGRSAGLIKDRKYYIGSQATITGKFDPEWFLTFFGNCAPGFFAWAVPEGPNRARVGVATKKKVYDYFELLRKRFDGEIVERQAGPIPIYDGAKNVQKDNIYLVGDAAGVCKNTTGGGIITGMWSAKILADSLLKNKDYSKALNPLRRELWIHEKIRNALDQFTEKDYEQLVEFMSKPKVKRILETHPREYPSRFMLNLLFAQPKFLAFAKYVFA